MNCPLDQIPIFVRAGSVLALAPEMQFTGEKPWNPVTLDVYPLAGTTATTTLYEDDTRTVAYRRGEFRQTQITAAADDAAKTVRCQGDALWRRRRRAGRRGF
jgi:alpha-glucosidase (family GH31 glycosyl hydrolase)